ncbi:MAG TPA: hypothetical protein ENN07_01805 [candidate division Zixibacteria bacterium]|nr:hypothetical protein [candidate division Zixibacteria bacterium]
MGTLFILIMSLFVLMIVLAHYFYSANTRQTGAGTKPPQPQDPSQPTLYRTEQIPEDTESLFPLVSRIRSSLAKHLPEGRETLDTGRFRAVFDRLEMAALQHRVSNEGMSLFSARLRLVLQDGKISPVEMDMLLDVLEAAIINEME